MVHTLPPEHRDLLELVDVFARHEVSTWSWAEPSPRRFPAELWTKLSAMDLAGLTAATEHGGSGLPWRTHLMVVEELARADASLGAALAMHAVATRVIERHGSRAQRDRLTPELADGRLLGVADVPDVDTDADLGAPTAGATLPADTAAARSGQVEIAGRPVAPDDVVVVPADNLSDARNAARLARCGVALGAAQGILDVCLGLRPELGLAMTVSASDLTFRPAYLLAQVAGAIDAARATQRSVADRFDHGFDVDRATALLVLQLVAVSGSVATAAHVIAQNPGPDARVDPERATWRIARYGQSQPAADEVAALQEHVAAGLVGGR